MQHNTVSVSSFPGFHQRDGLEFWMCICVTSYIPVNAEAEHQVPVQHFHDESDASDFKCSPPARAGATLINSVSTAPFIITIIYWFFRSVSKDAFKNMPILWSPPCADSHHLLFSLFQSQEKQDLHTVPVILDHVTLARVWTGSEISNFTVMMKSGFPLWVSQGRSCNNAKLRLTNELLLSS